MQAATMKRCTLTITRRDKVRNKEIRRKLETGSLTDKVRKANL